MAIDIGLQSRYEAIRERIRQAAARVNRDPSEITLIAVTKTLPEGAVRAAFDIGIRDFGENRVQELIAKKQALSDISTRWHLIGHLQSNKVRQVYREVVLIHSLDSLHLAERIDELASQDGPPVEVLLQLNTSGESTKFGVPPEEARPLAEKIVRLPSLRLRGLMTLGPLTEEERAIRESFRLLRMSRDSILDLLTPDAILSMGMSGDFEIAIEEGATHVRVGTALFGRRP
jgi:hypothetical protein